MKTTAKIQIRTNAQRFSPSFGVFDPQSEVMSYTNNEKGEKVKTGTGQYGQFVKQTDFNHGTFEMEISEARRKVQDMSNSARNCWVKLYIIE